jgi:hypothetical protein
MQDIKEEINKDIEILKNNQSEMNSSISQIKILIESWVNRVDLLKIECQEQKAK